MDPEEIPHLIRDALNVQEREARNRRSQKNPALETLIDSGSLEVFQAAEELCKSSDRNEKLLGIRILRELGRPDRPFSESIVDTIGGLIRTERDDEILSWEVSALGYQRTPRALPILWPLTSHSGATVREEVATAISKSSSESGPDDTSIEALIHLAQDSNTEVRFSSLFELASWWNNGNKNPRMEAALREAMHDPDSRIVHTVRAALEGVPD